MILWMAFSLLHIYHLHTSRSWLDFFFVSILAFRREVYHLLSLVNIFSLISTYTGYMYFICSFCFMFFFLAREDYDFPLLISFPCVLKEEEEDSFFGGGFELSVGWLQWRNTWYGFSASSGHLHRARPVLLLLIFNFCHVKPLYSHFSM